MLKEIAVLSAVVAPTSVFALAALVVASPLGVGELGYFGNGCGHGVLLADKDGFSFATVRFRRFRDIG
jgi:hypothetical protein